ncbi:MAG: hypothetical protein WAW96_21795 [Alphaproteobacteria bacterium]
MPTEKQQILIDKIAARLERDDRIAAAWLSGSLGSGQGDEWSDVDVLALVRNASAAEVGGHYARNSDVIAETVFVQPLYGGSIVHNITPDWERFDLSFIEAGHLTRYDFTKLKPLFSKGGFEIPPLSPPPMPPQGERVTASINEFIRVMGLAPLVMGRKDYVNAFAGIGHLRARLIDLLIESNGISPAERGGALHLNRLLTADQVNMLSALPPVSASRESVIESTIALAKLFFPHARALADKLGLDWPTAFEAATRRHLERQLGVRF